MNLPDFLIIGAMKAGTTTLYDCLRAHPEVGMSRQKETDFFLNPAAQGLDWYRGQFDPARRVKGEASPNYTKRAAFPGVPERAAALVPDAKLVFIARDPVARAASQYRHAILSGAPVPPPEALAGSPTFAHLVEVSSYAAQLDPWLAHYPRDRLLILRFEDLATDPRPVLSQLAAHLGIADRWPAVDAANSGESLARLPSWLFRLRQSAAAGWVKDRLSPDWRGRLKRAVSGKARAAPDLPPALQEAIARAVAADQARFARMAGG